MNTISHAESIRGRPLLRSVLDRDCATPIRGRPLLRSVLGPGLCDAYSRAATITLSSGIVRRLFEGGHYYAQFWDCATPIRGRLLIGCGVYSMKYGIYTLLESFRLTLMLNVEWSCDHEIRGQC